MKCIGQTKIIKTHAIW